MTTIELSKSEWLVLNNFAEDRECVATILPDLIKEYPNISKHEVAEIVYTLWQRGLISADINVVNKEIRLSETEEYANASYWFGLTEKGTSYWEEGAKVFDNGKIDWTDAWSGHFNFKKGEGFIDGTSIEVCREALQKIDTNKEWQIDMNSLVDSEISGFKAKYYKYIEGGHRITFKLKRR